MSLNTAMCVVYTRQQWHFPMYHQNLEDVHVCTPCTLILRRCTNIDPVCGCNCIADCCTPIFYHCSSYWYTLTFVHYMLPRWPVDPWRPLYRYPIYFCAHQSLHHVGLHGHAEKCRFYVGPASQTSAQRPVVAGYNIEGTGTNLWRFSPQEDLFRTMCQIWCGSHSPQIDRIRPVTFPINQVRGIWMVFTDVIEV